MRVSVLIPTYRRAHLLGYVLDGLIMQTFKEFEVLIVLKPSGDKSSEVVERYRNRLNINLVLQDEGYLVDALNLGLKYAKGEIIAFLDDDAVPCRDWVQRHVESYERYGNVGGVAGNAIPAKLYEDKPNRITGGVFHLTSSRSPSFIERVFGKVWDAPVEGMEDYLVYISKAGVVAYNSNLSSVAREHTVRSLLGMGANMSVLRKAVEEFKFPVSWVLGLAWEQFLGWHLWHKGYDLIFNPEARVYHLVHGESLTRNINSIRRDVLRWIENYLLFYRLYDLESGLSWMHRIAWLIFSSLINLKKICFDGEIQELNQLSGRFCSEIIGLKWLISRKIGGSYNLLADLEKLLHVT